MSTENSLGKKAPTGADLSLPPFVRFPKISRTSPESLAQTFSDPDPTTMLVSGSEKDASEEEMNSEMKQMAAVRDQREEEEGIGEEAETGKDGESATKERKLRVLTFCYEHGFVTRRIVENFLLTDVKHSAVTRILNRLVSLGYLRQPQSKWARRVGVYQLTTAGIQTAELRSTYKGLGRFWINTDQFDHDENTMEVRVLLERLLGGRWEPERSLKTAQCAEIPDGLLHLGPDAIIAVEVERSDKGKTRLKRLLTRWEEEPVSLVLYVCQDGVREEAVQKSMACFPRASHLATTTLAALRAGRRKVWTPTGELTLYTVADLT